MKLELSPNKKAAGYWDLLSKHCPHMIEIYICLLRFEQGLLTHYWVQPRAVSSARLRVGRMVQGVYMKLLMPKY